MKLQKGYGSKLLKLLLIFFEPHSLLSHICLHTLVDVKSYILLNYSFVREVRLFCLQICAEKVIHMCDLIIKHINT